MEEDDLQHSTSPRNGFEAGKGRVKQFRRSGNGVAPSVHLSFLHPFALLFGVVCRAEDGALILKSRKASAHPGIGTRRIEQGGRRSLEVWL